jgi:hypothetical protein
MTLTKDEVDRRVSLLKRLKNTLSQQRDKFRDYLKVLDAEQTSIANEASDTLKAQVELEEQLVVEIHAIQKVIDPLEAVLRESYEVTDDEVSELRSTLSSLQTEVAEKSRENRGLLEKTMARLSGEIVRLRPVRGRNPYAGSKPASVLVDITT